MTHPPPPRRSTRDVARSPGRAAFGLGSLALLFSGLAAPGCRFDSAERWLSVESSAAATCAVGSVRCGAGLERCAAGAAGPAWAQADDCAARQLVCSSQLSRCAVCDPGATSCQAGGVARCRADGTGYDVVDSCDAAQGYVCRDGGCTNPCYQATRSRGNVGCEYWPVDLDNADISPTLNAAAQQYAVVVSNPQPDVPVTVTITEDDSRPGEPADIRVVAREDILPSGLAVFKLGPREVDGSPDGEFNTGSNTALTRHAYRLVSTFPVVAFQFNPLDNVNVFSNDASLLKPVSALGGSAAGGGMSLEYVAVGWGQTIASSDKPDTNFDPGHPINLRCFLTLVGTRPGTRVRVRPTTRVVPGGPVVETLPGGVIEATLDPFDVLNLETGDFDADFTGSLIETDGPVVVYSGSEASDAPLFDALSSRFCCADHLEQQLDPIRTAGVHFVAAHGPSRTRAVQRAGGDIAPIDEPDYFRVVTMNEGETSVQTTLPPPDDTFTLSGRGAFRTLTATRDFQLATSQPAAVANVSPSQEAAGIKRGLPGGDPSLVILPPIEQWRADYAFLTPDKYAFNFVTVVVPQGGSATLDGDPVDGAHCESAPADGLTAAQRGGGDPLYTVYRCQLSFPIIDKTRKPPDNVLPGVQNNGVHRVIGSLPVGVLVSGFDSFVSYGYAAGTQLNDLTLQ